MMRRWLVMLLGCLILVGGAIAQPSPPPLVLPTPGPGEEPFRVEFFDPSAHAPRPGPLKILGLDDQPRLRAHVEDLAFQARAILRERTRVDWQGTAFLVWEEDERTFLARTGFAPEFTAAAASPAHGAVWINASAWRRSSTADNLRTLAHEFGHLVVGGLPGEPLPLWAEEGLVMHLANQLDLGRSLAVTKAHAFGAVPPLERLTQQFPRDPENQTVAYGASYLAVGAWASMETSEQGGDAIEVLMRRLANPQTGPKLKWWVWSDKGRQSVQEELDKLLGSRWTSFLGWVAGGTGFWIAVSVLLLWAWRVKKRRAAERAREEGDEEPWAASLTRRDIDEVWGDGAHSREVAEEDLLPHERWERMKSERGDDEEESWRS